MFSLCATIFPVYTDSLQCSVLVSLSDLGLISRSLQHWQGFVFYVFFPPTPDVTCTVDRALTMVTD